VEQTLKETYLVRDRQLNGMLYKDYLLSARWAEIKRLLYRKPKNRFCKKCFSKEKLNFHHLTYRHINTVNDKCDIMVFCEACHKKIHDISKKKDISVQRATISFINKGKKQVKKPNKEKVIIPQEKTTAQVVSELNNEKLLKSLNKYKEYFKANNSKPKSKRRK
jgi:hypothetical protein